jgi:actin-related protein 3
MFKDFGRRLQQDLKLVVARLLGTVSFHYYDPSVAKLKLLFHQPDFYTSCHTKAQYDEIGPSICRRYQIFGSVN